MIENALAVIPDDSNLQFELSFYKDHEPVKLLDLSTSPDLANNVSTYAFEYVSDVTDVSGITYKTAIAPSGWYETSHPYGWSSTYSKAHYSWLLDYQYARITGTLFYSQKYKNAPIEVELTISTSTGSAQSYFVSNTGKAQYFNVDLTGAKDFEISIEQSEIGGTFANLADVYIWK